MLYSVHLRPDNMPTWERAFGRGQPWACNDQGSEPDVVMASARRYPQQETLAAIALLREVFPDVKIRYVKVVDLFKIQPSTEHSHGLSDRASIPFSRQINR